MGRLALVCAAWLIAGCDVGVVPALDAGEDQAPDAGHIEPRVDAGGAGGSDAGGDDDAGAPEPGPACGGGDCDLWDVESCEPGSRCVWVTTAESGSAEAACFEEGTAPEGAACEGAADCAAGLDCTALDGSGVCGRYCCALNETGECSAGQYCRVALLASEGTATGVNLCDACDDCDPADPTACGTDRGCYPLASASGSCTACLTSAGVAVGHACDLSTDCEPGTACFTVGGAPRACIRICDLGDSSGCPAAITCREVAGGLPEGRGLCL